MKPAKKLPALEQLKTVHIIGVCGTLMGSFAAFLKRRGIRVTGSDQNVYPPMSDVLRDAGVELITGYRAENLMYTGARPDLVVVGNVISASNPEAQAAIEGEYAYSSLPEAMENLMLQKTCNIVVAGTHGKTTTSSLMAHVLVQCNKDPNYFIGGVSRDLPFSFQVSQIQAGKYFVLEGDEYDTAFWDKVPKFNHYLPDHAILTSVEYDHADIYPDFAAVIKAFEGLVSRVRPNGHMIACFDYPVIKDLVSQSKVSVTSYGSTAQSGADFYPTQIREEGETTRFVICSKDGTKKDELSLQIPGNHNVLNALAVWIESQSLGLPMDQVNKALAGFQGVKRRQELRGEVEGVMVIDDFAHHPTAVRETLKALKARYPQKRLIAVFEPRSATSRRKVFQKEYAAAFAHAKATFISVPFDQSKISASDQFSSDQLVDDLKQSGGKAFLMQNIDDGVKEVSQFAQNGDLIAVLSNGGFGGFIAKLLDALKR